MLSFLWLQPWGLSKGFVDKSELPDENAEVTVQCTHHRIGKQVPTNLEFDVWKLENFHFVAEKKQG